MYWHVYFQRSQSEQTTDLTLIILKDQSKKPEIFQNISDRTIQFSFFRCFLRLNEIMKAFISLIVVVLRY